MASSRSFFREYIQWRAKIIVYAAAALLIFSSIGLAVLVFSSAKNVYRFSLLLQLLAVLALIPHIVGKSRIRRAWDVLRRADTAQQYPVVAPFLEDEEETRLADPFGYYQTHNLLILLGNVFVSLGLMGALAVFVLYPQAPRFPQETLLRAVLAVIGFAWLNIFMLIQMYRMVQSPLPSGILIWFFAVDFLVGIIGAILAGMIYIVAQWLGGALRFVFANGLRRVLFVISLPFFVIGLVLALISTF